MESKMAVGNPARPAANGVVSESDGQAVTARLANVLSRYGIDATRIVRLNVGLQSDNFRVESTQGSFIAKIYQPDADLDYERANLQVMEDARSAGIAVLAPMRHDGSLLVEHDGLAVAVWRWCLGASSGAMEEGEAAEAAGNLARLHVFLRDRCRGQVWPSPVPHYRMRSIGDIRDRLVRIERHIRGLARPTEWDRRNLDRIDQRVSYLDGVPALLAATGPHRLDIVHGDYVRPNFIVRNGRVAGVFDFRIRVDDARRELGRLAFDVSTVAQRRDWLTVAVSALRSYLESSGIIEAEHISECVRLSLLHSCCSTLPLEEFYFHGMPHTAGFIRRYWDEECAAIENMLPHLPDIDSAVGRLLRPSAGRSRYPDWRRLAADRPPMTHDSRRPARHQPSKTLGGEVAAPNHGDDVRCLSLRRIAQASWCLAREENGDMYTRSHRSLRVRLVVVRVS